MDGRSTGRVIGVALIVASLLHLGLRGTGAADGISFLVVFALAVLNLANGFLTRNEDARDEAIPLTRRNSQLP